MNNKIIAAALGLFAAAVTTVPANAMGRKDAANSKSSQSAEPANPTNNPYDNPGVLATPTPAAAPDSSDTGGAGTSGSGSGLGSSNVSNPSMNNTGGATQQGGSDSNAASEQPATGSSSGAK